MAACEWCGEPAVARTSWISPNSGERKTFAGCLEHLRAYWAAMPQPLRETYTILPIRPGTPAMDLAVSICP